MAFQDKETLEWDHWKIKGVKVSVKKKALITFDTFSPIIKHTIIRLVLYLVVSQGWYIRQLDINNAFINGDLNKDVYMRQHVALNIMDNWHMSIALINPSMTWNKRQDPRSPNSIPTLPLKAFAHMTLTCSSLCKISIWCYLHFYVCGWSHYYMYKCTPDSTIHSTTPLHLKDLWSLHHFLGITIKCTPSGLTFSQKGYICDIFKHIHMSSTTLISTPLM